MSKTKLTALGVTAVFLLSNGLDGLSMRTRIVNWAVNGIHPLKRKHTIQDRINQYGKVI